MSDLTPARIAADRILKEYDAFKGIAEVLRAADTALEQARQAALDQAAAEQAKGQALIALQTARQEAERMTAEVTQARAEWDETLRALKQGAQDQIDAAQAELARQNQIVGQVQQETAREKARLSAELDSYLRSLQAARADADAEHQTALARLREEKAAIEAEIAALKARFS